MQQQFIAVDLQCPRSRLQMQGATQAREGRNTAVRQAADFFQMRADIQFGLAVSTGRQQGKTDITNTALRLRTRDIGGDVGRQKPVLQQQVLQTFGICCRNTHLPAFAAIHRYGTEAEAVEWQGSTELWLQPQMPVTAGMPASQQ